MTGVSTWRGYRHAARRGRELSRYLEQQAAELDRLVAQLNEHGFQLEHTMSDVAPKLETIAIFLRQPLVAAALPWVLRRAFRRPYRRR